MRLIVDKILWGSLLLLFGPTVMIVASWSALPGDNLYGIKLALERTALIITSPSYATSGTLQIKYTERRYAEAKQLFASKQSIQGLPYLEQQISETKKAIDRAPNKEAQVALAKQYINTLSTVSTELEAQKQTITTASPPQNPQLPQSPQATPTPTPGNTPAPTAASIPIPTPTPIQIAQVTTSTPITTQQAVAALQIDRTQQNVNQTIADLQTLVSTQGFQGKPPELTEEEKKERERWGTHSKEKRRKKNRRCTENPTRTTRGETRQRQRSISYRCPPGRWISLTPLLITSKLITCHQTETSYWPQTKFIISLIEE